MTDHYKVLELKRNASHGEVKAAYRRLARKLHPDVNPGDREAERRFKELNSAYEVLGDPKRRREYDRVGGARQRFAAKRGEGGRGAFDLRDLFGGVQDIFGFGGSRQRRHTATAEVTVELSEAYNGATRRLTVTTPSGERKVDVKIPAGIADGQRLVIHPPGLDLTITVSVASEEGGGLQRRGANLYRVLRVPLKVALLGGSARVETLSGEVELTVPPNTQNGSSIRLRGKGMPKLGANTFGDLFVEVSVTLPVPLSERVRQAIVEEL